MDTSNTIHSYIAYLQDKEKKIQKALSVIQSKREVTRKARARRELPVVAVVGYTNAGK